MSRSVLNDSTILRETKFSDADTKGRRQLSFTLPSGRVVKSSDWLVPSEIKGRVLISWADAIRAEDTADILEVEARQVSERAEKLAREHSSAAQQGSSALVPHLREPPLRGHHRLHQLRQCFRTIRATW
jgi:hypothetical protein